MSATANPLLLPALRERVAAIGADGRARALAGPERDLAVPLGHAAADRMLGGGLRRGAVHEVRPAAAGDGAAATGFALACAARLTRAGGTPRPWLWVRQDLAGRETGEPYGPGLAAYGLDPGGLVLVAVADARDVLRAAEEGLRCRALGLVLAEPWGDPKALDLTAARRLALAAEASGVPALMLRTGAHAGPPGAATRWCVAAAPSLPLPSLGRLPGVGRPAFAVTLERLRQPGTVGEGGSWTMEWDPDEHLLRDPVVAPARARPAAPADRPAAPAEGDWRRAG
ncbi:ImuA family protein [Alsobacter sp. R-9]